MSICASGASTTKPGVPAAVVVDQAYVQSLLPAGLAWLYPYLPFMHGLQIGDVAAFCALDPPTFGLPTGDDIFALVTGGDFGQAAIVQTFMQNVTRAYLWSQLCQCTSGTTPAPPTAPAAPTGLPAVNPPAYVGPAAGLACAEYTGSATDPGSNFYVFVKGTGVGATGAVSSAAPIPAGATSARIVWTITPGAGYHSNLNYRLLFYNSALAFIGGTSLDNPAASFPITQTLTIPAGTVGYVVTFANSGISPTSTDTWHFDLQFFCGGALPGQTQSPCCPPDPIATGLLNQILQAVTLIQRQSTPFAYVPGPIHSTLSGTGSISVSGILGLLASLTTVPTQIGDRVGTPERLFDAGWLNLGTADGYTEHWPLESAAQLVVPRAAGIYTTVSYSLHPGVVLQLQELVREP